MTVAPDVDSSDDATESAAPAESTVATVPASWSARAGAFAIDVLFGIGVLATVALVGWAAIAGWGAPQPGWLLWLSIGVGAAVFLAMAVNRLLLPAITGWSLGRSVFGIAVVRRDGSPVGPWLLLLRDLAHLLDTAALFIGWLWPLWDSRGRTFADLLTRTEVHRVEGEGQDRPRRLAGAVIAGATALAVAGAGLGYVAVYRHDLDNDRAREQIAVQGPKIVGQMLSYEVATLGDDFARAQKLVTDGYRPQLVAQQDSVRKGGPVDNDYWVTNSAVLSSSRDRAEMLILLQGQRGSGPKARLITATVRANFEKSAHGDWQVANLQVLARPNPGQGQ